jgi:hypothetical protein
MIVSNRCAEMQVRRVITWVLLFAAGATGILPASGHAAADTLSPLYQATPISLTGDLRGASPVAIPSGSDLFVEGLADSGLITFSAAPAPAARASLLLQWANGALTPIVYPGGGRSPLWPLDVYWPQNVAVDRPVSVNANGNVVFSVDSADGAGPWATYWWAAGNQTAVKVALGGEPATGNFVFTHPGGVAPALNNRDEIALIGQVGSPGGLSGAGLFFIGQFPGGSPLLRSVLLPGESLPANSGGLLPVVNGASFLPSIDDSGRIAFLVQLQGSTGRGAYVWEFGALDPVLTSGAALPSGARVTNVSHVSLNSRDRSMLLTANTNRMSAHQYGLYRAQNGTITRIIEPGSAMPGGGTLQTVQATEMGENLPALMGVSEANTAGEYLFLAALTDGSTGAYLLEPDGSMTPVFQTNPADGPADETGATPGVTFVRGARPCLNNQGEIALSMRSADDRVILLLTPTQQ